MLAGSAEVELQGRLLLVLLLLHLPLLLPHVLSDRAGGKCQEQLLVLQLAQCAAQLAASAACAGGSASELPRA